MVKAVPVRVGRRIGEAVVGRHIDHSHAAVNQLAHYGRSLGVRVTHGGEVACSHAVQIELLQ